MSSDRYVDNLGQPLDAADEKLPAPGPLPGKAIRWVWMSDTEYRNVMGAGSVLSRPECCGCHRNVPAVDAYSTVPVDSVGMPTMVAVTRGSQSVNRFSYVFCGPCRFAEDAEHAWRHALSDDLARPAGRRNKVPVKQLDKHPRLS